LRKFDEILIRVFDLTASLAVLILLAPLLILIAAAIKLDSPGPVFFRQKRLGKDSKLFEIFKFRTMIHGAESIGMGNLTAEDAFRITRVGKILRLSSIDELPQLIKIIRGEMSVVGPRPGRPEHLEQYTPRQRKRLSVKPGLTGLAQIRGRNSISWPQRIDMDLEYIARRSFLYNLGLIFKTIPVLFKTDFIYGRPENFAFTVPEPPSNTDLVPPALVQPENNRCSRQHARV